MQQFLSIQMLLPSDAAICSNIILFILLSVINSNDSRVVDICFCEIVIYCSNSQDFNFWHCFLPILMLHYSNQIQS